MKSKEEGRERDEKVQQKKSAATNAPIKLKICSSIASCYIQSMKNRQHKNNR